MCANFSKSPMWLVAHSSYSKVFRTLQCGVLYCTHNITEHSRTRWFVQRTHTEANQLSTFTLVSRPHAMVSRRCASQQCEGPPSALECVHPVNAGVRQQVPALLPVVPAVSPDCTSGSSVPRRRIGRRAVIDAARAAVKGTATHTTTALHRCFPPRAALAQALALALARCRAAVWHESRARSPLRQGCKRIPGSRNKGEGCGWKLRQGERSRGEMEGKGYGDQMRRREEEERRWMKRLKRRCVHAEAE